MIGAVSMPELTQMAATASDVLGQVREQVTQPNPLKTAPVFTSSYIADLCKTDRAQIRYLAERHELPAGQKVEGSKAREFSLQDTIDWVKAIGGYAARPEGKRGKVIAVCNYKGGVGKTSTAVSIAQGLTLRGLRVLLVDCDGQGSATQLCGISPERDVRFEQTVMPYVDGDQPDLEYACQPTYWHNLDIIPASSSLLGAEFSLPAKAIDVRGFKFWLVLKNGLAPLLDRYDAVVLDTSPSLGHLTVNAMFAADALVMPCPPEALDFASSVQFWEIFTELATHFPGAQDKTYDFITIVYTKTKNKKTDMSHMVRAWMKEAYGVHVSAIEIPESDTARTAAIQLKTIYDMAKPETAIETHRRYKDPVDALVNQVLDSLAFAWSLP